VVGEEAGRPDIGALELADRPPPLGRGPDVVKYRKSPP
jgi:hypothetical protein